MPLLTMRWQDLLFAHWPDRPGAAPAPRATVSWRSTPSTGPPGWVSCRSATRRLRPFGVPLPGEAIAFAEVNVRTYVRGPDGTPAVWFLSLDGDHRLGAMAARAAFGYRLPPRGGGARRVVDRDAAHDAPPRDAARGAGGALSPGRPRIEPTPLDTFLTDRLLMHGTRGTTRAPRGGPARRVAPACGGGGVRAARRDRGLRAAAAGGDSPTCAGRSRSTSRSRGCPRRSLAHR